VTRPSGTPRRCAGKLADAQDARRPPAPYRALDLVRAARTATRDEAFAAEDEALADLIMGDELRAGLYAFDLVQRAPSARPVRRTRPWPAR
jgi:hypothetical protein